MGSYIIRRLLMSIIVIVIITIISFMFISLIPGDPARALVGRDASQELVDAIREDLWLDRPLIVQYFHWMGNILQGDLGVSIVYKDKVTELIANRLPITMHLSGLALILAVVLGVSAGAVCAVKRGSFLGQAISVLATTGISIPIFWLGLLGVYLFSIKLGWLPVHGYTSPFEDFWLSTKQLIMPVICMSVIALSMLARQTRSAMLEVIYQDYIRTARSKGLRETAVMTRHALKNALIPVVTLFGMLIHLIITGSVLIEMVFNIAGMGRLLASSVLDKDFIVVQACVLIIAIFISLTNLIIDISYGWLDPRIRYQ